MKKRLQSLGGFPRGMLVLFFICLLFTLPNCSSSGDGDSGDSETFSNGGITLKATTTSTSSSKTTTVTDSSGDEICSLTVTTTGISVSFAGISGSTDETFFTPLTELPSDFATKLLAILICGGLETEGSLLRLDAPGCDWFPDTQCTLGCCADHDSCYNLNNWEE